MRTTISLDDGLGRQVRRRAASEGMSVSAWIARVLDDRLKQTACRKTAPFRLVTVGGSGVHEGIDLDRPRALLVAEDEETWGRRGR